MDEKKFEDLDEHDLKEVQHWITYYEKMYEKTGDEKYKEKWCKLEQKLAALEPIVKDNFQKAFMDAAIRRAEKDDLFSLDPDTFIKNLKDGDIYMEVSGKGDVEFIDEKEIIKDIKIDSVQIKKKKD